MSPSLSPFAPFDPAAPFSAKSLPLAPWGALEPLTALTAGDRAVVAPDGLC